ncbi:MAG TPA: outer membrane beta-barrel protein [Candidatus Acidoferrum sp.]|jgi:peptidoglycan-associated lipoprotein
MNVKVVVCLLGLGSLCGVSARAQDAPKFDVFAGYSYVRENPATSGIDSFSMNGGSVSLSYNATRWLSAVADLGGYHTNNILGSGVDGTLSTYLFGPRVSLHRDWRITPFGHVLFGVAHIGGDNGLAFSSSNNSFAMTVGGGVDFKLSHRFSIRAVQVDYLMTRFNELGLGAQNQNNLRVSTGVVFHF